MLLLARTLAEHHPLSQHIVTGRDTPLARAAVDARLRVHPLRWTHAWDPRALAGLYRQLKVLCASGSPILLHAHDRDRKSVV